MDTLLKEGRLKTGHTGLTSKHFTFASYAPTATIDWILAPLDWEFISYEVYDLLLSDHRPVIAEVKMQR